jgi:DNA-binding response OmpR family regulator
MAKILFVEDDKELALHLKEWLQSEQHVVDVVHDGAEALERLRLYPCDAVILDWQLAGELSGIDVCQRYRAAGGITPIIMLTGRGRLADKTQGLDAGADDYLPKPFEPEELSARLRALLRRQPNFRPDELRAGPLTLDRKLLTVKCDGEPVQLLPKEFALLQFFMQHPNEIFSVEAIMERVWPSESDCSPDTLRVHLAKLRQKLGSAGDLIKTIHRVGYKLEIS